MLSSYYDSFYDDIDSYKGYKKKTIFFVFMSMRYDYIPM